MPKAPVARKKHMPSADLSSLDDVRTWLAAIWLGGCALILLIVVLQSLLGKFGGQTQDAWGWLLPTIMPTLSMIIAVLGYTAMDPNRSESVVRKSFSRIATYLSTLYLVLILMTILVQPLTSVPPQELMNLSNLWLGPFQGLVASALGVLFVSKQPKPDESPG